MMKLLLVEFVEDDANLAFIEKKAVILHPESKTKK